MTWIMGWKMGLDRIMNGQKVLCGWGENQETDCKFMGDDSETRLMGNIWELSLYATEMMYKVLDTDYKGE